MPLLVGVIDRDFCAVQLQALLLVFIAAVNKLVMCENEEWCIQQSGQPGTEQLGNCQTLSAYNSTFSVHESVHHLQLSAIHCRRPYDMH